MDEDLYGNRKLFWKGMSNAKKGKVKGRSRIKDGNGMLARGEEKMRRIWKEYFKDLYNIDTQEQGAVHMCVFDGIRTGNYFGDKPTGRAEFEARVGSSRMERSQVRMRSLKK